MHRQSCRRSSAEQHRVGGGQPAVDCCTHFVVEVREEHLRILDDAVEEMNRPAVIFRIELLLDHGDEVVSSDLTMV